MNNYPILIFRGCSDYYAVSAISAPICIAIGNTLIRPAVDQTLTACGQRSASLTRLTHPVMVGEFCTAERILTKKVGAPQSQGWSDLYNSETSDTQSQLWLHASGFCRRLCGANLRRR